MKNKIKIVIDVLMTILFIILMGYFVTESVVHEIVGVIAFVIFIVHNIMNFNWYKSILKGKYNFQRALHLIINILLFIAMLGMMISGIMISGHVFTFLNIPTTMFGRGLHMISTSWGFVLIAIHVGLHMNGIMNKLNAKMKSSSFEYLYYLIVAIVMGFGVYSFISLKIHEDMFLVNHFKFFDYEQSVILYYLKCVGVIVLFELLIYYLKRIIDYFRKKSSNKKSEN